ncbi:MAG: hypothetical protein AB1640_09400 [bacterium]
MANCGLCGMEVKQQPRIGEDGHCTECGMELALASEEELGESELDEAEEDEETREP